MTTSHPGPPAELDGPLEVDPEDWDPRQIYFLLTGLVVPRPIAWVSTVSPEGVRNVAPHSYFNAVAHDPPHIVFSSSGRKDTLRNIEVTGEFVVNITSREVFEAMNFTACNFPPDEDEFRWANLDAAASVAVGPPRVAAARAALECRVHTILPMGNGNMVFGDVLAVHVAEEIWADGRIDLSVLAPVGRLGGSWYSPVKDLVRLPRPTWDEVRTAATE